MVDDGIAYPVLSSDWATQLVVVPKPTGVRLCGDFKAAIDEIIKNLPGTVAYLDDVLIGGHSYPEAVSRLEQVLQRFQEYGVKSDHQPLATIFGSKRGTPSLAAARLQRWALILASYDVEVRYRKASDVPHADALSRFPLPASDSLELENNFISHTQECVEVLNCFSTCTSNAAPKVPLQQWPRVYGRWQRVHIDFAEDPNSRQQMLVLVDSFSKWIEVFVMKSTSSLKTIERLRSLFASYGLPDTLVSDNGPSFTSFEFKEFLKKNGVRFVLSPPYHPASNGAAERCVQEVKKNLSGRRKVIGYLEKFWR
ncbi:uncharacterized protein LOC129000616 [Macrosteles quadrilineatus]|uniref:uncharacterized protein LOC129000616 n=1 Tax=Macrosteles quadrilineatus TaxID=74068 RepID=UPI0023E341CA|nr:uncharacterized protein LOC129000616 [Macrosteles quadrilineatus]